MVEISNVPSEKFSVVVNPFTSKVTIPESYIFSGYFHPPYNSVTFQTKLFNFLDRPSGLKCLLYHLSIFALVIITLTISALETVKVVPWSAVCLFYLEIILVIIFGLEYVGRIWSSGSQSCYQHFKGRLKYIFRLANIFDLVILIGSMLSLTIGTSEGIFTASTIKIFRLVQIMRIARVDRKGSTWWLLSSVIYNHRKELITSLYIGFLGLLLSSYIIFVVENYNKPSLQFKSLADAFYWGIVTVTTIGYGDITPETWLGKTVCALSSILIVSFFALPAGILGSGFALKVQQKQKQKHYNKQFPAAALLIQMLWRYNRTNVTYGSNATWNNYASMVGEYRLKRLKKRREMLAERLQNGKAIDAVVNKNNDNFSDYENYELTAVQRKQIRIICIIKFYVARKKFKKLRNPYDVQDVIEQYSQGHFHLMVKIKDLHRRLETTIGNTSEYKINGQKHTVMDSLSTLNKRMNKLETMLSEIHSALITKFDDNKKTDSDANVDSPLSHSSINVHLENSDTDISSDEDLIAHQNSIYLSQSDNSSQKKKAKALYNDRFYLGHQSVLSD